MRTLGIAIPTFERPDLTFQVFDSIHDDDRISSITISDDCSSQDCVKRLTDNSHRFPKTKLHFSLSNVDCFFNKYRSVWLSGEEWIALIDSDNRIDKNYLDTIYGIDKWEDDTIYTPEFAMPYFDFRQYSGLTITRENVAQYIDKPHFETCLNACNYVVNRRKYLEVFQRDTDPVTSDSIFFALCWLEAGNKIHILPGLRYQHKVWEQSHYRLNVSRTPAGFHESILNRLRNLK